ncbi:ribosome hibernation-promoting factor, HPF/YfiA family [Calderihabitans maritimus]|uniref:Ribosome hibernation promoting factor n=1 Tax=Calderihabitans maritimus TaxID=1246530 RepID=A0A1Z5HUZ1_9FIRM|nr:ribosome-associated translation inhibitor RaiA [Calderihabitans maritimus]GAW93155.1 ribosome-associated protein Y [Calderihabitans maritimus]
MNIIVRGKNIDVTNALREYAEKRLRKLQKYLDIEEVQVTLLVEKERHRVEVTIPLNGFVIRGEEESGDMYASVDMVIDKLERQINKYKTKLAKKIKNNSLRELVAQMSQEEREEEEEKPKIVRTKRFPIKPMPVEEAIMQMNLVGHNFFVFSNAETEEINVVYRRKDGNYGLIEPER